MKLMTKRLLSLLLAFVVVLGMGVSAFADNEAPPEVTQLQLSSSALKLYEGKTSTLTYITNPSDYKGNIVWSVKDADPEGCVTVSNQGVVTGVKLGTATVVATVAGHNDIYGECAVTVEADTIRTFAVTATGATISNDTISANVNDTFSLTGTVTYASGDTDTDTGWEIGDMTVVSVDSSDVFTARKVGSTTITASNNGQTKVITVNVTNITVKNATISKTSASMYPGGSTTLGVTVTPSGASYNVAWSSDNTKVVTVDSSGISTTVKAVAVGTATVKATITDVVDPENVKTVTCRVTVTNTANITGSATIGTNLSFSGIATKLKNEFNSMYGTSLTDSSSNAKVTFTAYGNSAYGTLYASSTSSTKITSTSARYSLASVGSMSFTPKAAGDYVLTYSMTDDTRTMTGTITISVSSLLKNITVNLDNGDDYTFSDKTKKDGISAATAIYNAVYDYYGTYSYLVFDSVSSASSNVGTLYCDSGKASVKNTTKFYRTGTSTSNYYVSDLYFVPAKVGTYSRDFSAYTSGGTEICSGTLKIVVSSISTDIADVDIYFNTTAGTTVTLGETAFESWFQAQKGSSYKLAYVTFDDVRTNYGSFKHSTTVFTPGNNVSYYADGYTGSTGSGAKYLKNVKFTAESFYGYEAVSFTCYGGTTSSKSNVQASGTLYIYATNGSVKGISYTVKNGTALTLDEASFLNTYKTAMSSTSSTTRYYIRLLELPDEGTLYYNYTSASKPGTRLTTGNYNDYSFYINGLSSQYGIDELTYVPANTIGSSSVRYMAYSSSGTPLYIGTVTFTYSTPKSMSCYSDGYTFKLSDFYTAAESDPVVSVTFKQPADGALYLSYENGDGTLLNASTKLYTVYPAYGSASVSDLTYVPKAGYSGDVTVNYTTVTAGGSSNTGYLVIAVTGKQASAQFTDVTAKGVGSWAADSIDFAYKWGLVNGTGTNTFSPDSTMSRGMLVAVLYRAAGSPTVSGECVFKDVPASAYYRDAVIWANSNGIINGTGKSTFDPDGAITREQLAATLYRYATYKGYGSVGSTATGVLNGYTDKGSVSKYAVDAIAWAVANGYITSSSTSALVLSPAGSATRAQVAVMLHRFLTY